MSLLLLRHVFGNWAYRFSVNNPKKKMNIAYDEIDSVVFYRSTFLAETRILPPHRRLLPPHHRSSTISPQCPERDGDNLLLIDAFFLLLIDAFFLLTIEADPDLVFQGCEPPFGSEKIEVEKEMESE
ncbi:hypothetical protein CsatA_008400 [Cannabis sativa]